MYRRADDKHESRGRSHRDYEDSEKASSRSRSRWDESKRDKGDSRNEWDYKNRKDEKAEERDRWKNGKRDLDGYGSSSRLGSKDRKRSRSRSRSPFRRSGRDYLNYSNPAKVSSSASSGEPVPNRNDNDSHSLPSRKCTSWSDSSDEDAQPRRSKEAEYSQSKGDLYSHGYNYNDSGRIGVCSTEIRKEAGSLGDGGNDTVKSEMESAAAPGISLKLSGQPTKQMPLPKVISVPISAKATKVAAIFNSDDDDEPEEMPAECKMRMKNVGRETKTSEGPNSFGKTKIGFCNLSHLTEKRLEGKTTGTGGSSKKS